MVGAIVEDVDVVTMNGHKGWGDKITARRRITMI